MIQTLNNIILFSVLLPTVTYDPETEEISVDTSVKIPLSVNGLPVATSFVVYNLNQK